MKKIDEAITKAAIATGRMGIEPVTVIVKLTDLEKSDFLESEEYDNPHYAWELMGNTLEITYTETPISESKMDAIAIYMDDDIRERVHFELAPCAAAEFLKRYIELDPDFADLLSAEFGIEL